MIRLHQLVEQLGGANPMLRIDADAAIKFDIGDISDLPMLGEFEPSPSPFPFVYMEWFEPNIPAIAAVFIRDAGVGGCFKFQYYLRPLVSHGRWLSLDDAVWHEAEDRDGELFVDGVRDLDVDQFPPSRCMAVAIAKIFTVMACSNVIFVDQQPSKALDKKRAQAGKVPLFSYKTLNLKVPNVRTEAQSLGGTHASPRIHLRRGHIRKLPTGATVWVQSSVVGSKHGLIKKDYRLVQK